MEERELSIELLYFDDCPSWENALQNVKAVLEDLGNRSKVALIRVETQDEAVENQFIGSPTIRAGGKDLFPTGQTNFGRWCRLYPTPEGYKGWPTKEMLLQLITPIIKSFLR